jgi:hypothetical protein
MQSFNVIFVYVTSARSALIPTHVGFEGFGSEGLIDATSKLGTRGNCGTNIWPFALGTTIERRNYVVRGVR